MRVPDAPTLVEVWAPWCAECRAMHPLLIAIASNHPEVALRSIDAAKDPQAVAGLGVRGTPTLIGYARGGEIFRSTGRRTSAELEEMFGSLVAGSSPPSVGRVDRALRLGSGVVLTGLGLAAGPAWVLVLGGLAVCLFAVLTTGRTVR